MSTEAAAPVSPFKGLAAFEDSELDALFFFGRERDRDRPADGPAREIADVVVLGHDEAPLLDGRGCVEPSVQLQHHCPALERQLDGVRVRKLDHSGLAARVAMAEPSAIAS